MAEHPKHQFTVIVNNQNYQTTHKTLTGSEIKKLAEIPADYELFEIRGAESVPVGNDQSVHIHERIEFRAIPAGVFG
jgi:hypothetical protein